MQLTAQNAQYIVATLNSNAVSKINVSTIVNALQNTKSTTFANLTQASRVKTKAAFEHKELYKLTVQNVTLCNSKSSLYSNAVNRQTVEAFTALPSIYTMIGDSYSVCALKSDPAKHYLRATINNCSQSVYFCNDTGSIISKTELATYLTKSAAKKLMAPPKVNHVIHANIDHTVTVRNFALPNIYSINLAKQKLVC